MKLKKMLALLLALAVGLNTGLHQYGDLSVMALDVGQGESVALYTREKAVQVDCGSSNSYISAGARAADQLESMGIHRLSAVAVTHYHADHTNGLEELLARMPVERLLLPEIQDEYGVRDRLLALARELDIPVTMVTDTYQFPMDQAMLTIYPPVGAGDLNEQGLTYLCSAGDFDALITGDMAGNTEKKLVERFDLPDIEVLVVGHHGSRYSSTDAFLQQVRPETAIISVGDNSYGHPTQEAMDRLSRNGGHRVSHRPAGERPGHSERRNVNGGKGSEKKRRSPGKAAGGYQKRQPGERVHLLRRGDVSAGPVSGGAEGPAGAGGL